MRRRAIAVLATIGTVLGTGVLAQSAPASAAPSGPVAKAPAVSAKQTPHTSAGKKATHPVRSSCAATVAPGRARCFALARTDVKSLGRTLNPLDTPDGYGPADIIDAYDLPATGDGQTVAIVDAFDNPNAESDLAVYRAQYGLPACTTANGCFTKVNQDGEAAPLPEPDAGWAQEISLDLDVVSAACPRCKILLVEADDNFNDNLAAAVDTAVSLGAKYVSNSYGGAEDPSQTEYDPSYNHPGVVVTASTGDDGYGTSYPATAPGVTAVGGTSLTRDDSARGWGESAWAGAGSGCSSVSAKPDFQTDTGCDKRAVADVSAVADPETGVAVYDSFEFQGWAVFGGTSASAPLIASTYALAGTPAAATDPAGYPYLATSQLNDVTSGDNGSCSVAYLCTAGPGYDGPTGLGTPKGVGAFRLGPHGTMKGTITDSGTKKPLAGAKVVAGDASTVTAADGTYTLSLKAGRYNVVASKYGYASVTKTGVLLGDGAKITVSLGLEAVPNVAVSGNVTDGSGHNWPLYAKVSVDGVPGAPVYTDPFTGHYELDLPSRNTWSVTVTPVYGGYTPSTTSVKLASADIVKDFGITVADSCAAPGYTTRYSGVFQNFDAGIPSTWTVKDATGGGGWTSTDLGGRGNLTGGSGTFAIIDSDALGDGKTQDTTLVSPVVDLSKDTAPVVGLNSAYKAFDNSTGDIDYTVDGGKTWKTVQHFSTTSQQGPLQVALPGAAGKKAVQVRFHYKGAFSYYWEVDDVFVGHKSCSVVPGGLVAGFTKDGNTGKPVTGVTVTSKDVPADKGTSATTPDDGTRPDGFYWLFSSRTGKHDFTAAKSRYRSGTASVTVGSNYVTRRDFTLAAGRVSASPAALTGSVTLGGSASASLTLKNTGTVAAHVELGEQNGGFVIAGKPAQAVYATQHGAPLRTVKGHYSPLREKPSATKAASAPAAAQPAAAPWEAIADYPTPISNNSASSHDGVIYNVGGFDGTDDVASAYSYDPGAKAWTKLPDMSVTREAPVSAWIGDKLYVTGGWGPDGDPTGITEAYDPAANTWTTVAENPKPHAGSGVAVLDGKLYAIGGCTGESCGVADVEVYDPDANTWAAATDYPGTVAWLGCGAIDGAIYCGGGTNDSATSAKTYSFDGDTWTPLADMPTDAWGGASSAANGQLVISGGVISNNSVVTNQGWSFDPSAGTWSALPNSNNAFYRLGGACGFYKIGGSVSNADPAHAESEVLPGYDGCSGSATDVPWISETPAEADLAPGKSVTIAVQLDSSVLTQPGTYTATLNVGTDTPYPATAVPVTFTVKPPATWGKITGIVSGKPCTGTGAPIPGATVQIDTWAASYTLTTDADGRYALYLDRRNNPLTVIAAKDGWAPQTRQARVTPGTPLTSDFVLKPAKACR